MADKTKTQNSERDNRKAWGKNHNVVKVKPVPSAEKVARRAARGLVSAGGAPVTMPSITWEWATRAMSSTRTTRRIQSVDAYFNWLSAKPSIRKEDDGVRVVTDTNLEVKESSARPSRKSMARAGAGDRKNGR